MSLRAVGWPIARWDPSTRRRGHGISDVKALAELEALGWMGPSGRAWWWEEAAARRGQGLGGGVEHAPRWDNAHTFEAGIGCPRRVGRLSDPARGAQRAAGFDCGTPTRRSPRRGARCPPRKGAALSRETAATYARL